MKGKTRGPIQSVDDIALYYLQGEKWVAVSGDMVNTRCVGTVCLPTVTKFDSCAPEKFRIWNKK